MMQAMNHVKLVNFSMSHALKTISVVPMDVAFFRFIVDRHQNLFKI